MQCPRWGCDGTFIRPPGGFYGYVCSRCGLFEEDAAVSSKLPRSPNHAPPSGRLTEDLDVTGKTYDELYELGYVLIDNFGYVQRRHPNLSGLATTEVHAFVRYLVERLRYAESLVAAGYESLTGS